MTIWNNRPKRNQNVLSTVAYTGITNPKTAHSSIYAFPTRYVHDFLFDRILSGTETVLHLQRHISSRRGIAVLQRSRFLHFLANMSNHR